MFYMRRRASSACAHTAAACARSNPNSFPTGVLWWTGISLQHMCLSRRNDLGVSGSGVSHPARGSGVRN